MQIKILPAKASSEIILSTEKIVEKSWSFALIMHLDYIFLVLLEYNLNVK
jgi:hypothetical protein